MNFMLSHSVSDFFPWNIYWKFHIISMISLTVLMCHCILVYYVEMLHWDWNAYWYEDSWFYVVEMVQGVVAWQQGYGIIIDDIQRINWWEVFMWCYRHYLLIYCLCGTVGPWVKVPKALEEDTPMWVYGGLVLPLGFSP